ncbi:MAG: hypothetical protein WC810_14565 [Janthinobacterium sp.]|jgi:hypothetical protein
MIWKLLLFVLAGLIISYLFEWVKEGAAFGHKKALIKYGLSAAIFSTAAFFINNWIVQGLLLTLGPIAFNFFYRSLTKLSA